MNGPGSVGHCPGVDLREEGGPRDGGVLADIHEEQWICARGKAGSVNADGLEREHLLIHDLHLSGHLHLYLFTGVFA